MAIIDVLKCDVPRDMPANALVWKWRSPKSAKRQEELRWGTQLVVNQSQIAVFVKGGRVADIFGPGTHTLSAGNLPILTSIISLPFGGRSPFTAEVYYINKSAIMDTQFVLKAFNMLEPNFRVPIPVTSRGSFAVRVGEAGRFLNKIIGTMPELDANRLKEYFRGVIVENVKGAITRIAREQQISPMELEATVLNVSGSVKEVIAETLGQYGLRLELFNIEGVSIVDDDPRVKKVVEDYQRLMSQDMEERMRLKRRAENLDVYRVERSFDTTEKAAENIGGGTGDSGILGTIVGLGMAQPLANTMAGVVTDTLHPRNPQQQAAISQSPVMQTETEEKLGKESVIRMLKELGELRSAGVLTEDEFAEKKKVLLSKI